MLKSAFGKLTGAVRSFETIVLHNVHDFLEFLSLIYVQSCNQQPMAFPILLGCGYVRFRRAISVHFHKGRRYHTAI